MTKLKVQGGGTISLVQRDFIASGGEGSVYGKGSLIYKIYNDPKRMIPLAKIGELSVLTLKNILRPLNVLYNGKQPIGFTMDWVRSTVPLCKLFTNDFRNRVGITHDSTYELVSNIRNTTAFIHDKKCLIVDGNEFNYLVDEKNYTTPYFIDVDSYQTPSFPATAIMASIKDWHSKKFCEYSDWFSFGIIACQLMVGIHPFKGKHPDYKKGDLEGRMKGNVSIFNKKTSLPSAARDFSVIPDSYYQWFVRLFEKGERLLPPDKIGPTAVTLVKTKIVTGTDNFEVVREHGYKGTVLWYSKLYNDHVVYCRNGSMFFIYINRVSYETGPGTDVIYASYGTVPILVNIKDGLLEMRAVNKTEIKTQPIAAEDKMVVNGRLYVKSGGKLSEVEVIEMGSNLFSRVVTSWEIMPKSSSLFAGVVVQNVLGHMWLTIPAGGACYTLPITELDGHRIVDAKYDNKVCIVLGYKSGTYTRFVIRFDSSHTKYDIRMDQASNGTINFITLDNGIAVSIIGDGEVELFSNKLDKADVKTIKDPHISTNMKLCKEGTRVKFFSGSTLYGMKMK